MAKNNLTFIDYVKAAFFWKAHVPLLGHMPFNILACAAFGILGFGLPAFWLLGLGLEGAYLLFVSGSDRFQNVVRGTQLLEQKKVWNAKQTSLIATLDRPARQRYESLVASCASILKNTDSAGMGVDDLRSHGLGQLLWTFLQLLSSRIRIQSILSQVRPTDLTKEIDSLKTKLTAQAADTPLARSLQGTLDITQKRLDNLTRAQENISVVDAEIDRIEQQFALLLEESSMSSSADALTAKLDGVMQSVQDTSRWLLDHKELLGSTDESPAPGLPDLPPLSAIKE